MARSRFRRFFTAMGVAAMVGLREATGLAPPPPQLMTEEIEWLSPEPEADDTAAPVFNDPLPPIPPRVRPKTSRPARGVVGVLRRPSPLRGWPLVFAALLVPSGIGSMAAVFLPGFRAAAGIHGFGLAVLCLTALGNLGGVFLVLGRSRWAPKFFTYYPPMLLGLTLLIPDLLGSVNARLAAIGRSADVSPGALAAVVGLNAALVLCMVVYWNTSSNVAAIFGESGRTVRQRMP